MPHVGFRTAASSKDETPLFMNMWMLGMNTKIDSENPCPVLSPSQVRVDAGSVCIHVHVFAEQFFNGRGVFVVCSWCTLAAATTTIYENRIHPLSCSPPVFALAAVRNRTFSLSLLRLLFILRTDSHLSKNDVATERWLQQEVHHKASHHISFRGRSEPPAFL